MAIGFTDSICEVLRRPLQEFSRRGPGGSYSYHKGSDVIRRLNEAFGHAWSSERLEERVVEDQVLILVSISVINKEGDVISHQGYGSAHIARNRGTGVAIDIGNSYKSAYTSALKKAAEQFGIGLGEDEEQEVSTSSSSRGASYSASSPAPRASSSTPQTSSKPPAAASQVRGSRTSLSRPEPLPPRTAGGSSHNAMSKNQISQVLETALASTSGAANVPSPQGTAQELPPEISTSLDDLKINDIQLQALTNLANLKGLDEKMLVKSAGFGDKTFKELTRTEAMLVIKHTNTLPQGQ